MVPNLLWLLVIYIPSTYLISKVSPFKSNDVKLRAISCPSGSLIFQEQYGSDSWFSLRFGNRMTPWYWWTSFVPEYSPPQSRKYLLMKLYTPFENPQRWMGQNTFPILLLNDDNMIGEH